MTNPEESLFPDWPQNTAVEGVVIGRVSAPLGAAPWPESKVFVFEEPTGEQLRDKGMTAAEEAAYAEWKDSILYWIEEYAHFGRDFTAEDVRAGAGDPPDGKGRNAIGAIFHAAARRGLIERAGWKQAERPSGHARALAVWRGTDG